MTKIIYTREQKGHSLFWAIILCFATCGFWLIPLGSCAMLADKVDNYL
jgi:hypothetical protein